MRRVHGRAPDARVHALRAQVRLRGVQRVAALPPPGGVPRLPQDCEADGEDLRLKRRRAASM